MVRVSAEYAGINWLCPVDSAGVPFLPLGPGVTPNSSKDQEWRQQAGWGYSGILAGGQAPGTNPEFLRRASEGSQSTLVRGSASADNVLRKV